MHEEIFSRSQVLSSSWLLKPLDVYQENSCGYGARVSGTM